MGLGNVLTSQSKWQEALPHLERAASLRPDDEVCVVSTVAGAAVAGQHPRTEEGVGRLPAASLQVVGTTERDSP